MVKTSHELTAYLTFTTWRVEGWCIYLNGYFRVVSCTSFDSDSVNSNDVKAM